MWKSLTLRLDLWYNLMILSIIFLFLFSYIHVWKWYLFWRGIHSNSPQCVMCDVRVSILHLTPSIFLFLATIFFHLILFNWKTIYIEHKESIIN